jgi:tRNA modification GTPase
LLGGFERSRLLGSSFRVFAVSRLAVFSTTDTIVAIATPPGRGGIGVVRVSGPSARAIAMSLLRGVCELEPRHATFARLVLPDGTGGDSDAAVDHIVATYFPAPASYTGDDVVEISAHGSPVILNGIVRAAVARGARLAEPGEFTLRAYVNGRMDLMQAEAVADLVDAVTPLQARAAFDQLQGTLTRAIGEIDRRLFDLVARLEASVDFPEESYHFADAHRAAAEIHEIANSVCALLTSARRGRLLREGLQVAIVGAPNAGKSTLFNALVGANRAIVTDVPGTTRDLVTETIDLEGLRVTLVDTAGIRETSDVVESAGVERSHGAASVADVILFVVDSTQPPVEISFAARPTVVVLNKCDVSRSEHVRSTLRARSARAGNAVETVAVSALTGEGLDGLRQRILSALDVEPTSETPAITNVRHIALVERAHNALKRAERAALTDGHSLPEEFVLADLHDARAALEEVSGTRTPDDLLAHIFSRFCIGK